MRTSFMSETPPYLDPQPRSRRRLWLVLGLLIVAPFAVMGAWYGYRHYTANRDLEKALAETDQLDPRWRLEDVLADRAAVPDERNSGLIVIDAKQLLPKRWPEWEYPRDLANLEEREDDEAVRMREALDRSFSELEPQQQLGEEQIVALYGELERATSALAEARKLADSPEGRYPIAYSDNFVGTLLPHIQDAREIAKLLANDALFRAQEGDVDGALASCRGVLNAGRSVGDEPSCIAQLVRIALRGIAVDRAQRTLAQGQPTDRALREMQELLETEEQVPLILIATRGERGGIDRLMESFQSGKTKLTGRDLAQLEGLSGPSGSGPTLGDQLDLHSPGFIQTQRAAMLRYLNRAVEAAKSPTEEQRARMREIEATAKSQPVLVRLFVPALSKINEACLRTQAQLRCASAALAAERYRQAKGRWPEAWDELIAAGFLREKPIDLYDGKPLRMRRMGDGLVIYSVGPDGEDNGGNLDRKRLIAPGTDLGFRLWDVDKRRQAAPPFEVLPREDAFDIKRGFGGD
jgi:hypothetical protein